MGMSDVMPYPSRRFTDLSPREVEAYEWSFADRLLDVARKFQPRIIHSHHLWLVTAVARQMLPHLPLVATCHGSACASSISVLICVPGCWRDAGNWRASWP